MKKWLKILYCNLTGCIYPLKKLPTPSYMKIHMSEGEGAFSADTSKPCHRCGRYKEE